MKGAAVAAQAFTDLHWTCARLQDLGALELHEALALRCRVFVVEQRCAYQDVDDIDHKAWHLMGRAAPGGPLLAVLRIVDPGACFTEPALGRVATAPEARGTGLGRRLLEQGLQRCQALWPGQAVRISAQAHLQDFYGEQGFATVSEVYLEDDIAHVDMLRQPPCLDIQGVCNG